MKPYKTLLLIALTLCVSVGANAQASLAAENSIEDISVTLKNGRKKVYSVFRDNRQATQWYYVPNEVRVAEEINTSGKPKPKVTILRYQYQDKVTKENKEGGVLVATLTTAMEPEVVEQVKKHIIAKKKNPNVTLSAMPLNTSKVEFLADSDEFVAKREGKSATSTSGATSASQEFPVTVKLSDLGASVMNALLKTNGGVPISNEITYNGLTAPCGFKITGKWSDVYKYYEKNTSVEARFSLFGIGGGGGYSKNTVNETLGKIENIKVEQVGCLNETEKESESTAAKLREIEKMIQEKVYNRDVLTKAGELEKLQSLINGTQDPTLVEKLTKAFLEKKASFQVGLQRSIKDVTKRQTGDLRYSNDSQKIILRTTTLGGGISLARFFPNGTTDEQLKKAGHLIDIDAANEFPSVVFGLPNLNPDLGLRSLIMEIVYKTSDGKTLSEARQWDATKGWLTPMGKEVGFMRFNLLGEKDSKRRQEPEFNIKVQVVSAVPNASFTIENKSRLSLGEKYIDAIEVLTRQISVDGTNLDFKTLTQNADDLAFAKVVFNNGTMSITKDIKPMLINGTLAPPNLVYFLLPKNDSPVTSSVIYYKPNGEKVEKPGSLSIGENTLVNEWRQ